MKRFLLLLVVPLFLILFLNIASSTTLVLQDADTENLGDSYVSQSSSSGNYGTYPYAYVLSWFSGATHSNRRMYLMFDITQVPADAISITGRLDLYCKTYYDSVDADSIDVFHVTDYTWDGENETTITWDNQVCGTNFDDSTDCNLTAEDENNNNAAGWWNFTVTQAVNRAYDNDEDNVSFAIKTHTEDLSDYYGCSFYTKENGSVSAMPTLVITYTTAAADTCTPPASGDWTVDCNDNCTLSDNTYLGGSLNLEGSNGNFTLDAHLSMHDFNVSGASDCTIYLKSGSTFNVTSQT